MVAARALLELVADGGDVRPAMVRRLGEALRRLVSPAEALMLAEVVELAPSAEALMLAWGEVAGARIFGLAPGWSP